MTSPESGISMETYLRQHADQIACTGCGQCCPTSCAFKAGTSCDIHPKKTSREVRMSLCQRSPVEFFLDHGSACQPVLDVISTMTHITPDIMEHRYPFPQPHRDLPGCVYVDPIAHAQIRETIVQPQAVPSNSFIPLVSIHIMTYPPEYRKPRHLSP